MHQPYGDGSLAGDLSLAVVRFARRLRGRRENKLVSLTQLSALSTLHHEGPMTPGALAAAERVRPPSMTRVIASLSDLGMIKREPHPTDGRQAIVTLAPAGRDVVTDELAARKAWLDDRLSELTSDERDTLRQVVAIMNKMINSTDN
ncbi:regulatory protein MarR [Gordonia bronchialis DSM 43247]|uniref:Regulatory protein MarR n=1 Tax=Gordonia bronchialis (strain ATCC 25592 / DSM 43247 / BCRC 13721 / JCM 3198 / KCTC 3076 / NBRC 16047 / NCTC 10667) TaxID=526226 RepID=D0L5L8_GORB4|nr:MarR family transcriptional regulator [Gordonia bronchialis]ACY20547.1 regulatory protein MarR [Gordonia bronchialis DSM 43247]MCC3323318.1 MarR family transcriptional regulator [Gordonia bronchialis]QGS25680.1 MarR family transcriptional regulator [Gordonia bronchialis]